MEEIEWTMKHGEVTHHEDMFLFQRNLEFYNGSAIWIVSTVSFSFPLSVNVHFAFQDNHKVKKHDYSLLLQYFVFIGPNWLLLEIN